MAFRGHDSYDYLADVPASPQDVSELVEDAVNYLVRYGAYSWGSNPKQSGEFYGFYADEEGIDAVPIVGYDSAPTYTDTIIAPRLPSVIRATSVLALNQVTKLEIRYVEDSQQTDAEDGEGVIDGWSLNFGLYGTNKRRPVLLEVIDCYDEYDDDDDEAQVTSVVRNHSEVQPELTKTECETLSEVIRELNRYQRRHGRRRRA